MIVRKNLDFEMNLLKEKLKNMGLLAQEAFIHSIEALTKQDTVLASRLISEDAEINQLEEEIEELVVKVIASQQPVASDLRKIMSAIKIATSIERIGDFAVDICKAVLQMSEYRELHSMEDIVTMAQIVQNMIQESLEAFVQEDVQLALETSKQDDQVDALYSKTVQDLLKTMLSEPQSMDQIIQLAFIARYIERIADHVTNILEAILYSVKGKRINLNQ